MYVQLKPIGFISTGERRRRGLWIRFLRWAVAIKPTRREMFSERNGFTKTYRIGGLSVTFRRVRDA